MKAKRYIYAALGALVLAAGCFSTYRVLNRPMSLPEFPHVEDGMPAAVLELEPDFAYRTGDIIGVRIYIRQPAGISCDTRNLLVNGDTKVVGQESKVELLPDGSSVLRLDVKLQNFVFSQKVKAGLKIEYRVAGSRERKELQLPELEYSTSRTFDGDQSTKHPKDPPYVYETTYGWLFTVGVATVALSLMACSFWYLLKRPVLRKGWWKKDPLLPDTDAWKEAVAQVHCILERLKAGEPQLPLVTNLDGLLRRLYNLDAVTVQDLEKLADKEHPELMSMTLASQFCQQVIYAAKPLSASEIGKLCELVVEALAVLPRANWKGWLESWSEGKN